MNTIAITTECVADLPQQMYQKSGIDIIYYDIKTDEGVFRDTEEINSENVIEYMAGGLKQTYSVVPTANDFKNFFQRKLRMYDEVIHICISSGVSEAYENAKLAKVKMGRDGSKIHIVDSLHLSSGQGLLVLEAARLRAEGLKSVEIVKQLEAFVPMISTSFLADNANYLYYNGKVGKTVKDVCNIFHIHPVLALIKGKMTVEKVYIGSYRHAAKSYIRSVLKNVKKIDTSRGFITYAGCSDEILQMVEKELEQHITFDQLNKQMASATVSCNCGPGTFGILYARRG